MPLEKFTCSICGAKCPKKYLKHGGFGDRMRWLRRHYKRKHPAKFRLWNQYCLRNTAEVRQAIKEFLA